MPLYQFQEIVLEKKKIILPNALKMTVAVAMVACPHRLTSLVGVNQRRLNSEADEKIRKIKKISIIIGPI